MNTRTVRMAGGLLFLVVAAVVVDQLFVRRIQRDLPPAPPAAVIPSVLDLGERRIGDQVVQHFSVTNSGGSDLVIDQVYTSCSCTGMEYEQDGRFAPVESLTVPPGQTIDLAMRVSVRGAPAGGAVHNIVRYRTNDPQHPTGEIDAIARLKGGGLSFHPRAVVFGKVRTGDSIRRIVDVRSSLAGEQVIKSVSTRAPDRVRVRVLNQSDYAKEPPLPDLGQHIGRLEVTVETSPHGEVDDLVTVELQAGEQHSESFPVTGKIVRPAEIAPAVLVLPRQSPNGPVYDAVALCRSSDGRPLQVTVDSVPPGLSATVLDGRLEDSIRQVRVKVLDARQAPTSWPIRLRCQSGQDVTMLELQVTLDPLREGG